MTTSFEEDLAALLRLANEAHENNHVLQGQVFADERGWLKEDEQREMADRHARAGELESVVHSQIVSISSRHAAAWDAYLDQGISTFIALQAGSDTFDASLGKSLEEAWRVMRAKTLEGFGPVWALAVGQKYSRR